MTITLTKKRKENIYGHCSSLLTNSKRITVRELIQTIGTLVAAFRAVPVGTFRHLEKWKVESLRRTHGDFDKQAFISTEAKIKLKWWRGNINSSSAPIRLQPVDYTIYSDASSGG